MDAKQEAEEAEKMKLLAGTAAQAAGDTSIGAGKYVFGVLTISLIREDGSLWTVGLFAKQKPVQAKDVLNGVCGMLIRAEDVKNHYVKELAKLMNTPEKKILDALELQIPALKKNQLDSAKGA